MSHIKRIKRKRLFIIFFFFIFLSSCVKVNGVIIPDNKVIVLENGTPIIDGSVIINKNYSRPICTKECYIGLQYDKVTFYKVKESNVLTSSQWLDKQYLDTAGCESYVTKKYNFYKDLDAFKQTKEYKDLLPANAIHLTNPELQNRDKIEQLRIVYMQAHGHLHYGNPKCSNIGVGYNYGSYIKDLMNNALYSVTINLRAPEGKNGSRSGISKIKTVDIARDTVVETDFPKANNFNNIFQLVLIIIFLSLFLFLSNVYTYLYIKNKSEKAGLSEPERNQWCRRAVWLGLITLIFFIRYLNKKQTNSAAT